MNSPNNLRHKLTIIYDNGDELSQLVADRDAAIARLRRSGKKIKSATLRAPNGVTEILDLSEVLNAGA